MKRISRRLLSAALLFIFAAIASQLTTSCRVAAENGSFDAQWRLDEIIVPDGTTGYVAPHDPYVYWSFWRHTCTLMASTGGSLSGNIVYVEDESLTIEMPVLSADQLKSFCLPANSTPTADGRGYVAKFDIEKLTSKKLVMRSVDDGTVYYFTKF